VFVAVLACRVARIHHPAGNALYIGTSIKKVAVALLAADCEAKPYSASNHTFVPGLVVTLVEREVINNLPTVAVEAVVAVPTTDQRITETYDPFTPAV
jgi:hypothetical protein